MTDIGTQLKLRGLELAEKHHSADLTRAKDLANALILLHPEGVSTDLVHEAFLDHYQRPLKIGNATGAIFSREKWECCGRIRSKRPSAHARWISVWRRKAQS